MKQPTVDESKEWTQRERDFFMRGWEFGLRYNGAFCCVDDGLILVELTRRSIALTDLVDEDAFERRLNELFGEPPCEMEEL